MELSESLIFYLDLFASAFGLGYILLATKQNNWCWLLGIISSSIYVLIFISSKFYFDAILNSYYILIGFYGLYNWNKISNETGYEVTRGSLFYNFIGINVCGLISITLGYFANNYTDADFAYADAFTTIFSFFATWLITQKRIENWIYWIVIDAVALVMYINKGLLFTSGLFILYLAFAVYGYFEWKKKLLEEKVEKQLY